MSAEISNQIESMIAAALPGAEIEVTTGSPGHFALVVRSDAFEGKRLLEKQRMVYRAIAPLMGGDDAPVHAIDSLKTLPSGA
jgi:acid stress-induced BolA-like protein IbaG/YrbA